MSNYNQFVMSSQLADFLRYYVDPESETFANAYRSGLRAGYSKSYSRVITLYH